MSEIIQVNIYDQSLNTGATLTLASPIAVGNIVVVAISGGTGTGYENVTATDNLGNTYTRGCLSQSDFGWIVFYAYVTTGGAVTVTTHNTLGDGNAGGFIFETQGNGRTFSSAQAIIATLDNGPLPPTHANGRRTSPMTPSGDSAVFSFLYKAGGLDDVASGSGDTFVAWSKVSFPAQAALFEQYFSGTGDAYIPKLYGGAVGTVPQAGGNIAVICFSKPLARPGGLVAQYAINPGRGYDDRDLPAPIDGSTFGFGAGGKTQRRCHVIFPYPVLSGSLLYAVFTQGILNLSDGYTITASDTYGNVWTAITGAVDEGNGSIQGFYAFALNLPAAGVPFRITAVITGPFDSGQVHQTPGFFIVERSDITSGTPAGTNVLSTVAVTGGYDVTTKSLTVAGPALLTAVFALAATAWTALESYTIQSHWDIQTLPDPSSGIFAAMPQIVLEDKIVPAGTYNAKVFGESLSSGDGTAVLIAIPVADITLACPVNGGAAIVGTTYSKTLVVTGGTEPFNFAITAGSLPPGLTLNATTGVISGTPTTPGDFPYTVQVTDVNDLTDSADCEIIVAATLIAACPTEDPVFGVAFSVAISVSGGTEPYTFELSSGPLPAGLSLNASTGVISGTATEVGTFPYSILITDDNGFTVTIECEFVVQTITRTLRWQCASPGRPGRWFPHLYSAPVITHYLVEPNENAPNDQELFMLSGGAILVSGGDTDAGAPITVTAEPGSIDLGDERAQKLYVDAMTEADQTGNISAQIRFNNSQQTGPTLILSPSGPREQFLENIASLSDLSLYRNISVRYSWTGGPDGPRIYAFEPSSYLQPYLSTFLVTQFINLSFPAWKSHRRMYPALISNAPVIFTIKTQDGRSFITTIPSTGGQYRIIPLIVQHGCKQLAFAYQLDGQGTPFALFPESFTVETKSWDEATFIDLAVFRT